MQEIGIELVTIWTFMLIYTMYTNVFYDICDGDWLMSFF